VDVAGPVHCDGAGVGRAAVEHNNQVFGHGSGHLVAYGSREGLFAARRVGPLTASFLGALGRTQLRHILPAHGRAVGTAPTERRRGRQGACAPRNVTAVPYSPLPIPLSPPYL
jgi:hypothetical protein